MEKRGGAYPPPQPATYATVQQPYGQPNRGETADQPPAYGQAIYSESAPSNFTPTPVAVHVEAYSVPADSTPHPIQDEPAAEGWFARQHRNKPQTNSAGSATLILVSGGMNIAWSCRFAQTQAFLMDTHILICWYIGAIVGALVSAFITNQILKKPIFMFSGFLVLIGGILFLALPHEYGALVAARYLNGFAVGLVVVPVLVLIGEQVDSSQRGMAASLLEMGSFSIGIFLQVLLASVYHYDGLDNRFGATEINGIICIIYSGLSLVMSYFLVIESPIYYLLRNEENQALHCLRRLRRPCVITNGTYHKLEELKRYVEYNNLNNDLMLPALLKLCSYRGLIALSFSPLTTLGLMLSSLIYVGPVIWPFVIFGVCLWLGCYIAAFLIDFVGRKKLMLIGAFACACMAIGVGAFFNEILNFFALTKVRAVVYLLFFLELFAGVFNSSSSAYLTEAFPLKWKSFYIAISFIVQFLVLLLITICKYDNDILGSYFITFGVFYGIAFFLGILFLPETKKLSLQETQDKFRTVIYNWNL